MTRHLSAEDQSIDKQWRVCKTCQQWIHVSQFPTRSDRLRHCFACGSVNRRAERAKAGVRTRERARYRRWYRAHRAYVKEQRKVYHVDHKVQINAQRRARYAELHAAT